MSDPSKLDRDETEVLRVFDRPGDEWRHVMICRSGGGEWRRNARQRLKRKGLLESSRTIKRAWRITDAGRQALKELSA